MNLSDIVKELSLEVKSHKDNLGKDVTGGYSSDLLSDVMANGAKGNVWITLQTHPNIVAVSMLKDLAGIIIVGRKRPEEETLRKAEAENVVIMTTPMFAYEVAGKIYQLLNK